MGKLNLEVKLEIDTESHTMRMVNQRVLEPTVIEHTGPHLCQWPPCGKPVTRTANGRIPKFCGRPCYGLSRRTEHFVERHSTAKPVVDAVTGIIALPPNLTATVVPVETVTTLGYRSFTFPQL